MTTAILHERDKAGIFAETPPAIHAACRVLLDAKRASIASVGKRMPDEITYAELMSLCRAEREASNEVERVVLAHQGRSFLSGLYRVDGWLVGFRKVDKGGLTLVVYPSEETKKGLRS